MANTVSYAFLLFSFVVQILLNNTFLVYQLYGNDVPTWIIIVRDILTMYPAFNYAKAFGDIA